MSEIIWIGNVCPTKTRDNPNQGRVYSVDGIAPALHTCQGGNLQPMVVVMDKEYIVCEQRTDEGLRLFNDDVVGTIRTINAGGDKRVIENSEHGYRIRKLTPKECWRLMGFTDEDFYAAKTGSRETAKRIITMFPNDDLKQSIEAALNEVVSDSQLYKQAGNSIVTDVLFYILKNLYVAMPYLFNDLKVGSYFSGIGAFEIALNRLFEWINNTEHENSAKSGGEM